MRLFLAIVIFLAIATATTLIYHRTQQADINYYQGHVFFEKAQYDKAKEFCERTLAVNPSHTGALRDLAYASQWTGDFERAIEAFSQLLSIEPDDYKAMTALAETLAWNKEYKKSIAVYREIISATGNIKIEILLGQVYIWDKQFDNAKKVLQTVLTEAPDDFEVRLLYAKALHYSGEPKEAIEIYKGLLEELKEDSGR
jgi:tetratricopeptide (TPR) repeat protein